MSAAAPRCCLLLTRALPPDRDHALPLNHLVMDMDWHTSASQYSWNTTLIPDPAAFMTSLHGDDNPLGHPLKYLVNLHPNGVGSSESHYKDFVRAMHDQDTNKSYKCDLSQGKFAAGYFDWMMGANPAAAPNSLVDYCPPAPAPAPSPLPFRVQPVELPPSSSSLSPRPFPPSSPLYSAYSGRCWRRRVDGLGRLRLARRRHQQPLVGQLFVSSRRLPHRRRQARPGPLSLRRARHTSLRRGLLR